jgi:hypothetical protein
MLESTRGQPQDTPFSIPERGVRPAWVTRRLTTSFRRSISKVTRDFSDGSSGSIQVKTRRLGGLHSNTSPIILTASFFSFHDVLPFRALFPIRDIFVPCPILTGEFGLGNSIPKFLGRRANKCHVNELILFHAVNPFLWFSRSFLRSVKA